MPTAERRRREREGQLVRRTTGHSARGLLHSPRAAPGSTGSNGTQRGSVGRRGTCPDGAARTGEDEAITEPQLRDETEKAHRR